MARYMIDTNILYFILEEKDRLTRDVSAMVYDAEKHYDPSDHIIIAHAITMGMPLISSDKKFPFYREQGLDLVANF